MTHVFKVCIEDRFPGQVTSLSHIGNANKVIKNKLTPTQLDMFRRTILGRLVDVDLVFNSPLVHHILLREVMDERPDVMSFDLRGTIATFSKKEFMLLTGLWQAPEQVVHKKVSSTHLRAKYFNGMTEINLKEFEQKYENLVFKNDEDAVKISLVYYIELAMMGKDKVKTLVDRSLYGVVDDLQYFNSLDWGTIIWERTLKGLQRAALADKVKVYKKNVARNKRYVIKYSLTGFPHAFQVLSIPYFWFWAILGYNYLISYFLFFLGLGI